MEAQKALALRDLTLWLICKYEEVTKKNEKLLQVHNFITSKQTQ